MSEINWKDEYEKWLANFKPLLLLNPDGTMWRRNGELLTTTARGQGVVRVLDDHMDRVSSLIYNPKEPRHPFLYVYEVYPETYGVYQIYSRAGTALNRRYFEFVPPYRVDEILSEYEAKFMRDINLDNYNVKIVTE